MSQFLAIVFYSLIKVCLCRFTNEIEFKFHLLEIVVDYDS